MASYSNTDTGSKPDDPYKEKNVDQPELKEKIEDLVAFMEHCKFGMMTTRIASSGLLTSRCMALAAKVCPLHSLLLPSRASSSQEMCAANSVSNFRKAVVLTSYFILILNPARRMTYNLTPRLI